MIQDILIEGLIYAVMVLGVFTTFRVLGFCDMTVDGSFPLGSCVLAACLSAGVSSFVALPLVLLSGALSGLVTSGIHNKLKIPDLLSGILTMTMLYSVNLRIMGNRANVSFLKIQTVFSTLLHWGQNLLGGDFASWVVVLFLILVLFLVKTLLDLFFHTDLGLVMGALGANKQMVISQGINPTFVTTIGICVGNALAALSGALSAMYNGFADVTSGTGVIVSGLASLMLGEFILKTNKIQLQTLRVILGSILYRALMYFARNYGYKVGLGANDLKLINGLLIILCLVLSQTKLKSYFSKRARVQHAKTTQKMGAIC